MEWFLQIDVMDAPIVSPRVCGSRLDPFLSAPARGVSETTWPALQLVAMGSRCGKLCAYPLTSLESCEVELQLR